LLLFKKSHLVAIAGIGQFFQFYIYFVRGNLAAFDVLAIAGVLAIDIGNIVFFKILQDSVV